MGVSLNKAAYQQLIDEDVKRLNLDMPRSLERDHIEAVLKANVKLLYPEKKNYESS